MNAYPQPCSRLLDVLMTTYLDAAVLWQIFGHVPGHDNVRSLLLVVVLQGPLLLLLLTLREGSGMGHQT